MGFPIHWLLVGSGDIAVKRVAPALAETKKSRLAAVCDLNLDRAREVAAKFGADAVYEEYAKALDDPSIDAVYIATPVGLHAPMAVMALEAGKNVLCEKPLGLNADDATRAVEAAERSGLVAGCAYFRRLYPAYRAIRTMLETEAFGKIVLVRMAYYSWFDPKPEDPKYWRVVSSRSGGGPIADMGSHMFDMLIGLFGLPEQVFASTACLDRAWDVEDSSAMVMTLPGGVPATASYHWNSKTWLHMFEVVGTEARVLLQPFDGATMITTVGRETTETAVAPAANVHAPLIADFVEAVETGGKPCVTFAEAAKTNRLMDAIYRSARGNREEAV